jgi:hypothetical protein
MIAGMLNCSSVGICGSLYFSQQKRHVNSVATAVNLQQNLSPIIIFLAQLFGDVFESSLFLGAPTVFVKCSCDSYY